MTDPTNVELARQAFVAIADRGLEGALDFLDPECEFEPPEDAIEQGGVFKGHEGIRQRWDLLLEPFADVHMELEDVSEADPDNVLVVFRVRARGRASGAPVEMGLGYLVTIRDGRALRIKAYLDPSDARRAAGLESPGHHP
jgi:ketosteroid isomerase-like protein